MLKSLRKAVIAAHISALVPTWCPLVACSSSPPVDDRCRVVNAGVATLMGDGSELIAWTDAKRAEADRLIADPDFERCSETRVGCLGSDACREVALRKASGRLR